MTDFSPDVMYQKVLTAGEDWADKKAAYEALDDCTRSVLAGQMDVQTFSVSKAETIALASNYYMDHLSSKSHARREWLLAEVNYKALIMLTELRRTESANRRTEMRLT